MDYYETEVANMTEDPAKPDADNILTAILVVLEDVKGEAEKGGGDA